MDHGDHQALLRSLAALRATQLRRIADQDLTLTRLSEALAAERAIQQMDTRALLAFCTALEARFTRAAGGTTRHRGNGAEA